MSQRSSSQGGMQRIRPERHGGSYTPGPDDFEDESEIRRPSAVNHRPGTLNPSHHGTYMSGAGAGGSTPHHQNAFPPTPHFYGQNYGYQSNQQEQRGAPMPLQVPQQHYYPSGSSEPRAHQGLEPPQRSPSPGQSVHSYELRPVSQGEGGDQEPVQKSSSRFTSQRNLVEDDAEVNDIDGKTYNERPQRLMESTNQWHHSIFRWGTFDWVQNPAYIYDDTIQYRYRDFAARVCEKPLHERYLDHDDGRLRKLTVACVDDIYQAPGTSTWRRTYVRNVSELKVRIATWIIDYDENPGTWKTYGIQVVRAFLASMLMVFLVWETGSNGSVKFSGRFAPFPYYYFGTAKVWRNQIENNENKQIGNTNEYRVLKPRHLCFLRKPDSPKLQGYDILSVEEWEKTDGKNMNLTYTFVAWSTIQFRTSSRRDMKALHQIAEKAARSAGVVAFWVSGSCMRVEEEEESDVFRIADVLRGASDLIIVLGQPPDEPQRLGVDELLKQWGERMWTFPEVLLSPGKEILVYIRGENSPIAINKNQFAGRVWEDAHESRQLVDSYIGTLGLSRLEKAVIALGCLYRRKTVEYLKGDQAYALMGLLRLRPQIDVTDTQFQAFARLSMANDSDALLERYICTLPKSIDQPWYNMEDTYESSLWDIYPYTQVAAVCDNDTVILDGAFAASVVWDSFFPINYTKNFSFIRKAALYLMNYNFFFLIISLLFFTFSILRPALFIGVILLLTFVAVLLRTPKLVKLAYGGKFSGQQAAMFGVEGYISAATVERALFGGAFGRMSWSINTSPLSRSILNSHGERIGIDPTRDPQVLEKVKRARYAKPGEMRIFTLIDTYNMEVTLFEAVNPPISFFLCASEGGMQRAVGCSYDWTAQTMYRETVLRLPTATLEFTYRVHRVKIGMRRPQWPCRHMDGDTHMA
ncbi:hypothetical protein TWF594_005718 [Orbilia oligospora]|nr:hypothetical protein TWF706_004268 [Orbilia oligospora]KAF3151961.1 hypothetical protein TWF594_005718 [Orbilia oligospora]